MVANVIGRDHGVRSEGVLYFKIPLHIFRILEVAGNVIQVRNGKGALRVEAASKRCSCAGVATAARAARRQTSAAIVVRQKRAVALRNQVHAAGGKCGGSRGRQVERHGSRRYVEQVYLRKIRIKQAQKTTGVKVGELPNARANHRILTEGAPGKAEPWLEDNFFDTRDDGPVAGWVRL